MKPIRYAPAVLALCLSLTACAGTPAGETPPPSSAPPAQTTPAETLPATAAPAEAPVWGEFHVSRTFTAGDGTAIMQVDYALPQIQNPGACPAGAAFNAWYEADGQSRLLEDEEEYEMALADYEVSTSLGFAYEPSVREMTSEVVYQSERVFSVRRTLYSSYGGAHPSVFCLSEQFDAASGKKLAFSDFFTDTDTVISRVTEAFLTQSELKDGGYSRDTITLACQPENFYLTEAGYVFWIQGSSLPAVNSPVEVTLSFDQLADVSCYG